MAVRFQGVKAWWQSSISPSLQITVAIIAPIRICLPSFLPSFLSYFHHPLFESYCRSWNPPRHRHYSDHHHATTTTTSPTLRHYHHVTTTTPLPPRYHHHVTTTRHHLSRQQNAVLVPHSLAIWASPRHPGLYRRL